MALPERGIRAAATCERVNEGAVALGVCVWRSLLGLVCPSTPFFALAREWLVRSLAEWSAQNAILSPLLSLIPLFTSLCSHMCVADPFWR